MGRLFWKFFFFIWLAQLTVTAAVGGWFWWERQASHRAWEESAARELPPGHDGGPPPRGAGPDRTPGVSGAEGALPSEPPPFARPRHRPPGPHLPVAPLVFGTLASLLFAALLARYFSRPIGSLRHAFAEAAAGRLDIRAAATMGKRRDELADLGQDFDHMVSQLQALVDGQRRLLHDVSHELRSPLARLQAMSDLVRQQPERLEESLGRIDKECRRMDTLIGELLMLSRLEAGIAARPAEEIEVGELLADIVADAQFEAAGKDIAVTLENAEADLLRGDPELFHRALENIVRNALKFSPAGSTVQVSVHAATPGSRLVIAICDDGPGVPEDDLERIFQPFYRSPGTQQREGHGLGLAISRQVIEGMGGRIAASRRPSGGLCVTAEWPG